MTDTGLDIQLLWSALQGLEVGLLPEETTVPTVRIQVEGGAVLEVFRAQVVEAAMVAWRVRGFTDDGSVRLAVILGTQDGRAMVTERVIPEQASTVVAGLVTGFEPSKRGISDLSEAIAAAVRERMGDPIPPGVN